MQRDMLATVTHQVARSFPEMANVRPTVRRQEGSSGGPEHFLLVYKGRAELPDGRTIHRIVRVVVDESGRIVRMSTSK